MAAPQRTIRVGDSRAPQTFGCQERNVTINGQAKVVKQSNDAKPGPGLAAAAEEVAL